MDAMRQSMLPIVHSSYSSSLPFLSSLPCKAHCSWDSSSLNLSCNSSFDGGNKSGRRSTFHGRAVSRSLKADIFGEKACRRSNLEKVDAGKTPVAALSILADIAKEVGAQQVPVVFERSRVDPRSVVSVILGGGAGTHLFPLTRRRAKAAVLAATQTPGDAGMNWFQGNADAVRRFTWLFQDARNRCLEHVLILSGDHLYRMDY
eukprot:c16080_g2_i2 orf=207-818(+)